MIHTDPEGRPPETVWLTTRQVAKRLSLSVGTIENWRYMGKGPVYYKTGKIRYKLSDIIAFENKTKSEAE
jgi:hypothetical protein